MKQAYDWNFYSEDKNGNRNEEGTRYTSSPARTTLWQFLKESLDNDEEIVKVGYELVGNQPVHSGQQGKSISKL